MKIRQLYCAAEPIWDHVIILNIENLRILFHGLILKLFRHETLLINENDPIAGDHVVCLGFEFSVAFWTNWLFKLD